MKDDQKPNNVLRMTAARAGEKLASQDSKPFSLAATTAIELGNLSDRFSELSQRTTKIETSLRKVKQLVWGVGLTVAIVLAAFIAKAEDITLTSANGPYSLDFSQQALIAQQGVNLLSNAGISVSLIGGYQVPNNFYEINTLPARLFYFRKWIAYFGKHSFYKSKSVLFIAPPILGPGGYYTAGYAQVCPLGFPRVAMVNAIAARVSDGASRLNHASVAIAHELGHLYGARHDSRGFNMMHPNAIGLYEQHKHFPGFSPKAQRQFRSCKSRRKQYASSRRS